MELGHTDYKNFVPKQGPQIISENYSVGKESMVTKLISFSLFFLLFFPFEGYANTLIRKELANIWKDAPISFGPLRIKAWFSFNNAGYDSNVYRKRYDPINDFTFSSGPTLSVYLPIKKRIVFSIYESPQYVYYMKTKSERAWSNDLSGGVHFVLNQFLFSFIKGYSDERQRWNTEVDISIRSRIESLQTSIYWIPTKKIAFSLGYITKQFDHEMLTSADFDLEERLNRLEKTVNVTGFYKVSLRTKSFLTFEYESYKFEMIQNTLDSKSYTALGGFEFSPLGILQGRIVLGYRFLDFLSRDNQDYHGIVGNTQVSVRLLKRFRVRASYIRDINFSIWYENSFFQENRYSIGASVYLFLKIRLDYDFGQGRNNYSHVRLNAADSENIEDFRKDEYNYHQVGIYFKIKENIGIGVIVNHWDRDSNLFWEMDKRTFIGLNLTFDL